MEGGPPVFSPDSSCPLILRIPLGSLRLSLTGLSPSSVGLPMPFNWTLRSHSAVHTPQILLPAVSPLPLSLATTHGISVDFSSSGYLDVSVPRVPRKYLLSCELQYLLHGSSPWGFPHSDICGSMLIYNSPQLFAVSHVLRRLLMPRHSPCALFRLNFAMRCSLSNCLSFLNLVFREKVFTFVNPFALSFPPFGEIVVFLPFDIGKTLKKIDLLF